MIRESNFVLGFLVDRNITMSGFQQVIQKRTTNYSLFLYLHIENHVAIIFLRTHVEPVFQFADHLGELFVSVCARIKTGVHLI